MAQAAVVQAQKETQLMLATVLSKQAQAAAVETQYLLPVLVAAQAARES